MKNIKEERAGVKLRYCQQASRCTVCGFVGDMKTAYAASRCQQNHNLCMLAFGRVAVEPF